MRLLALLLAVPTATAWLVGVSVRQDAASATVAIAVSGTFRHTAHHWTGTLNTLVVDIHPARLAFRPGIQHTHRHLRVRTGQFQQLTARVVIESPQPFVWTVSRTPSSLEARIEFPGLRSPAAPATPKPSPAPGQSTPPPRVRPSPAGPAPEPTATSAPQPGPQAGTPAARTFAIVAAGTLQAVAQTIAAIAGTRIKVDPSVADRLVVLKLSQATLQQALAELARQTGTRWTTLPDGSVRISP